MLSASSHVRFLKRFRWPIYLITILLSAFFAWQGAQIKIYNVLENMLPKNDTHLQAYREFNEAYGGDFIIMLSLEFDETFTHKNLASIERITKKIQELPYLDSVYSLANAQQLLASDGEIILEPLLQDLSVSEQELQALKKRVQNDVLFNRSLIHPQKPVSAIYIKIAVQDGVKGKVTARDEMVHAVERIIENEKALNNFTYHLGGSPTLEVKLDQSARLTQIEATLLVLFMIVVILYVLFRHRFGILLIVATIGFASVWTIGLAAALGKSLNFVTTMLPSLILIVSVLDCIHIYAIFRKQDPKLTKEERLQLTLKQVFIPCLLTTLTTVVGFGTLQLSQMEVIQDFGLFAVVGILTALFLALGPFCLMLLALPDQEQSQSHRVHPALFKTTDKLIHWNQNHSNLILLFFLLLTLGFGLGLKDLHVETKPISYYKKGSAIRNAFEYFDANFRGSTTIDILLNGPAGAFKDPQNLKAVEKILNEYQKDDRVSPPLTAIDYLKRANQALHDGDLAFFKIPESQEEIAQVYLFLEGEEAFSDVLRDEYSELRLTSRIQALGSRVGSQIMMRLEKILNQNLPKGISFTVTGTNVVWANMENYIADSLTRSFVGTIILVTIMMMLVLKSWKWGLISMIPNLVPIVMVFGLMGWVGIPLNMITLMIASIAIGIAVDDTIHLTIHIRKKTTEGMGLDDAIVSAFHHIGLAVISTSVILALGFLTMVISSFIPTQQFGFYTALTVVFALLCDLLLLPAVLKLFQRVL